VLAQAIIGLVVAPLLAATSTLASRSFGPRAGGVVSAFPAIVGPVLLITAFDHGAAFAARAANGTLLGLPALGAFAVAYGRAARRRGWAASLVAAWVAAALTALAVGLCAHGAGSPAGLLVAATALIAATRALPPTGASAQPGSEAASPRAGGIPLRMGVTALLVISLSAASGALGPVLGGMLVALPILASVLAVFTHRESGGGAAAELLRGTLAGMAGFVAFCQLAAMALGAYGIAAAFAAATAIALVVQAITACLPLRRLLRQRLLASSAPAGRQPEHRVVRRDPPKLLIARVRSDAVEEHADLGLPALQVGAEQRRLLVVEELGGGERLGATAKPQPPRAASAEVADPLRVPARRDEVASAVHHQQVDGRTARLARLTAAYLEHP
jgi:hypothetical protein